MLLEILKNVIRKPLLLNCFPIKLIYKRKKALMLLLRNPPYGISIISTDRDGKV